LTLFLVQKIIEHSQSKDKFLRASLRRIYEAQNFEDQVMRMSTMNEMQNTRGLPLGAPGARSPTGCRTPRED
jgi:hypothetical protein